jgi:hypothetical protein
MILDFCMKTRFCRCFAPRRYGKGLSPPSLARLQHSAADPGPAIRGRAFVIADDDIKSSFEARTLTQKDEAKQGLEGEDLR